MIDPITLETKGIVDWAPALSRGVHDRSAFGDGAFCAHPKWDEDTGDHVRLVLRRHVRRT